MQLSIINSIHFLYISFLLLSPESRKAQICEISAVSERNIEGIYSKFTYNLLSSPRAARGSDP